MLSIELRDEDDHWYQSRRVNDLRRAYTVGRHDTPDEVRRVTGYAISELLAGILPALLDVCLVQAAATTLGAVVGGALGSLAGGVGAVPGAIEGAATGFGLSATLLGWLGLTFLFVAVGQNLGEVAGRLTVAVRLAWDASDYPPEQRHEHVRRAGHILAEAMALLMLMILQAIVAWLLKKGLDKLPELVAELRSSKLGQGFAEWVEKNAAKLYDDPKLRPRRVEGSTSQAGASQAQSPSQLAKKPPLEESPSPPPPKGKPKPGSPEHKADRWEKYQNRGGEKTYDQWSKQYDTNMRNYQHGLAREADYRSAMDATEGTLKTPLTNRQIDILKADEMYAGQLKTGPVSLTKENALAIQKDAELVKQNWEVEHILEQGASQPYLDALKKAGIKATIGPQIP